MQPVFEDFAAVDNGEKLNKIGKYWNLIYKKIMRYLINSSMIAESTQSVSVLQNLHIKQFNVVFKFIFCMILHDIVNFVESYY